MTVSAISQDDRFAGCLLGLAVGDALGAPADIIYLSFGSPQRIVARPPAEGIFYTDDTEMMISVAETLLEYGRVQPDALCAAF